MKHFLLIIALNITIYVKTEEIPELDEKTEIPRACRERIRPVTDVKDDNYNVIEGNLGGHIKLQCHFCAEEDDGHPKNWFKMDPMDDSKQFEVPLDMYNNISENRIHVNAQHTLTIHNLSENDRGEYFCKGFDGDEVDNKYNFLLDVVIPTEIKSEEGNIKIWRKYHDEQYKPINHLFNTSNGPEYRMLIEKLRVHLEMVTEWDPEGPCEICGRPKGAGKRYKRGHCRLKISRIGTPEISTMTHSFKMVTRATHLSCRSVTLNEIIPGIINRTSVIPDFVEIEVCDGICNPEFRSLQIPDAEGVYKGWRSTKKKGFKYKKTFVLAENAHLTLICPESTLENTVVWKINNQVIKPGEIVVPPSNKIEPRVTVDSFNTLYLYGVTKEQEGNYTCYVDKVRMQQVRVFVVSKARLLTQAFVRHMMYLAFVLSLTLSCYCAGLIVTWTRRHKFKSYEETRHHLKKTHKLMDDDLSEITVSQDSVSSRDVQVTRTSISPSPLTMRTASTSPDELQPDSDEDISSGSYVSPDDHDYPIEESPLLSDNNRKQGIGSGSSYISNVGNALKKFISRKNNVETYSKLVNDGEVDETFNETPKSKARESTHVTIETDVNESTTTSPEDYFL